MSIESNDTVPLQRTGERHTCAACGGPMMPREETIIRLGHADEVRFRERCVDPWCGRSLQVPNVTLPFEKRG
jgi:hypothetical protein